MRICYCCNSDNNEFKTSFKINVVNDIKLNSTLKIYYCSACNFYYSDSGNTQTEYNEYYKNFNNYKLKDVNCDKDLKCCMYLKSMLNNLNINKILDYGSGNGKLAKLLSDNFKVSEFDIGMCDNENTYDCVILSHVLEHIYDLDTLIMNVKKNINDNGLLYIEIPNAEYYNELNQICPLQEINIEHINFFSKYALNKLLIKHNFFCIDLRDDYFNLNKNVYYVIRGLFKINVINNNFCKYIDNGLRIIKSYNFKKLLNYKNIYLYGCGQFLFKILDNITNVTNVINIIDDNPCYHNKKINNINIINYEDFKFTVKEHDIIILTTLIHDNIIKEKLLQIDKDIKIFSISEL